MRLLICAGGTGGGIYPALAVHSALTSKRANVETLWVGGENGMEAELVKRANIPFAAVPAAGVHGVGLRALPNNLLKLARGMVVARRILRSFRPDVLFFTGGFIAAPMAFAGWRVPAMLYVPDIEPALALKVLSLFADSITVTAEASKKFFTRPERIHVTGYPLRADLSTWSREKATQRFGLSRGLPTLLIFGGSKGARSINMAALKYINDLLEIAQVIHVSGSLDWPVVEKTMNELPAHLKARYHAMPYLHDMGAAYSVADLVVSRAGASTLGEFPLFGLPAILVPYPHAWRYQKVNADYLAQRGAAVILQDELLESELFSTVKVLLENPTKRESMRRATQILSHTDAAYAIADQLLTLAGEKSP
ncbi:MAG: undecaprenyldiphospho-muramoylpentapeptide beta-N-acetylglucosaminyltransferase [Anaerolineales bacterium]|nr:undecaprenyldiphospho-muramoylpentapeptide beta-N-acetylglucosaminyltransferase [Anaerolineales bacterium]